MCLETNGDNAVSISGISSFSSASSQKTDTQAAFRQQFNQLVGSLQSGSLSDAQQAYSTLSQLQSNGQGPSVNSNSPLAQTLDQIGQDLQNGDLSGAQQALSSLQQSQGSHHHHHHHGGGGSPVASQTNSSATVGATGNNSPSTSVDITA
jgi:soluble cytochrome b562